MDKLSSNDEESILKSNLTKTFQKWWGYSHFRENQLETCVNILMGNDTLIIAATGTGKSICYQLPPLMLRDIGFTNVTIIVISPLISLIEDQIASLNALGISAGYIGSDSSSKQEQDAIDGKFCVLFSTPEKMVRWQHGLISMSQNTHIICLAIDESHCVSEWGHDFRRDFNHLSEIRETLTTHSRLGMTVPILALTATATSHVQNEIIQNLKMKSPTIFKTTFNRPNLKFIVKVRRNQSVANGGLQDVCDILLEYKSLALDGTFSSSTTSSTGTPSTSKGINTNKNDFPCSLIYVSTIKDAEDLTDQLKRRIEFKGIAIACYHGSMSTNDRRDVHQAFLNDHIRIIIATIAFGMGINKPDIRLVLNYGLPKSVESYYQQSGRAGRDGLQAYCVLLYNRQDVVKSFNISTSSVYSSNSTDMIQKRIYDMNSYATLSNTSNQNTDTNTHGNNNMNCQFSKSVGCRRRYLLKYFDEIYNVPTDSASTTNNSLCCDLCDERLEQTRMMQNMTTNKNIGINSGQINLGREVFLLLLTISDCHESYGIAVPINILLGSHNKSLDRLGQYASMRTFGLGLSASSGTSSTHSLAWWKALGNYLVESVNPPLLMTALVKTAQFYSYEKFMLTPSGRDVLKQYKSTVTCLLDQRVTLLQRHKTSINSLSNNNNLKVTTEEMTQVSVSVSRALQTIEYLVTPVGTFKTACLQDGLYKLINTSATTSQNKANHTITNSTSSSSASNNNKTNSSTHINTNKESSVEDEERLSLKLYDKLISLRFELSQSLHMTSYNILSTSDLKHMSHCRPTQPDHLLGLSGWGQWKINSFGHRFCQVIQQFCQRYRLTSFVPAKSSSTVVTTTSTSTSHNNNDTNNNQPFDQSLSSSMFTKLKNSSASSSSPLISNNNININLTLTDRHEMNENMNGDDMITFKPSFSTCISSNNNNKNNNTVTSDTISTSVSANSDNILNFMLESSSSSSTNTINTTSVNTVRDINTALTRGDEVEIGDTTTNNNANKNKNTSMTTNTNHTSMHKKRKMTMQLLFPKRNITTGK